MKQRIIGRSIQSITQQVLLTTFNTIIYTHNGDGTLQNYEAKDSNLT